MPSSQTPNYQLNQWVKSDKVLMEDFNADNAKIDAAIKAVDQRVDACASSSTVTSLASRVDSLEYNMNIKGNAMPYVYPYIGYGSTVKSLPFNHRPALVILMAKDGSLPVVFAAYGVAVTNNPDVTFTGWPTKGGITDFTGLKYNEKGKEYVAIGILDCIH